MKIDLGKWAREYSLPFRAMKKIQEISKEKGITLPSSLLGILQGKSYEDIKKEIDGNDDVGKERIIDNQIVNFLEKNFDNFKEHFSYNWENIESFEQFEWLQLGSCKRHIKWSLIHVLLALCNKDSNENENEKIKLRKHWEEKIMAKIEVSKAKLQFFLNNIDDFSRLYTFVSNIEKNDKYRERFRFLMENTKLTNLAYLINYDWGARRFDIFKEVTNQEKFKLFIDEADPESVLKILKTSYYHLAWCINNTVESTKLSSLINTCYKPWKLWELIKEDYSKESVQSLINTLKDTSKLAKLINKIENENFREKSRIDRFIRPAKNAIENYCYVIENTDIEKLAKHINKTSSMFSFTDLIERSQKTDKLVYLINNTKDTWEQDLSSLTNNGNYLFLLIDNVDQEKLLQLTNNCPEQLWFLSHRMKTFDNQKKLVAFIETTDIDTLITQISKMNTWWGTLQDKYADKLASKIIGSE